MRNGQFRGRIVLIDIAEANRRTFCANYAPLSLYLEYNILLHSAFSA